MTRLRALGSIGWLIFAFVAVASQSCTQADAAKAADKVKTVEAAITNARDAATKPCADATRACAVYYDAVEVGLLRSDDRAELACASVATACALAAPAAP